MAGVMPIIRSDMHLYPIPSLKVEASSRKCVVEKSARKPRRKILPVISRSRCPKSSASHAGKCVQIRFHDVHGAVLCTIEEEETEEPKVTVPVLDIPAQGRKKSVPASAPSAGHVTVWDKLVHRISHALGKESRYELQKNVADEGVRVRKKSTDIAVGLMRRKNSGGKKPDLSKAQEYLEAQISPIPMQEKQRFHFQGRC